eukprot:4033357-Pyramimonas_sp.AAC.1
MVGAPRSRILPAIISELTLLYALPRSASVSSTTLGRTPLDSEERRQLRFSFKRATLICVATAATDLVSFAGASATASAFANRHIC